MTERDKYTPDPNLPSGRQKDPQVASTAEIKQQQNVALGSKLSPKEENNMADNENANNETQETQTNAPGTEQHQEVNVAQPEVETTLATAEEVPENEGAEVAGEVVEQADEAAPVSEEAEGYDSEATDVEDGSDEMEAELEEELIEESLDLFEEILEPLEFNQINNVLVFTLPVDMRMVDELDEETVDVLQAIPGLTFEGETLVETETTVNAYNPFDKESGWITGVIAPVLKLVNNISKQRLPILAGTSQMQVASDLIGNNISNAIAGIVNRENFGSTDALSGFVQENDEIAEGFDDSDLDLDDLMPSVQYDLSTFFTATSFSNFASPTLHNIVNNFEFMVPSLYEKSKPAVFLTKLIKFFAKRAANSDVPVYLNFTFTTADIVNNTDVRDMVDALVDAGALSVSRTEALDALDSESVLPEEMDVTFASDLDKLFGTGDLLLTVNLNPVAESDEDEASE